MFATVIIGIILLVIVSVIYIEYKNNQRYKEERRKAEERRNRKLTPKVTKRKASPLSKTSPKPTATPQKQESKPSVTPQKEKHITKEPVAQKPATEPTKTKPAPSQTTQPAEQKKTVSAKKETTQKPVQPPKRKPADTAQTQKASQPSKPVQTTKPSQTTKPQTQPEAKTTPAAKRPAADVQKPKAAPKAKPSQKEAAKPQKAEAAPTTETQLPKGEYPDFNYERLIEMGLSEEEALEFIQELIPQIGDQIPLIEEAMSIPDFHQIERLTHSIKGSSTTIGTGGVSDLLVDYNTYVKTGKELPVVQAYQKYLKIYFEKLKKQFPPKE